MVGKKQHYVPQFLLRNYAFGKKTKRLHVFDKKTDRIYVSSVRDAGHENNYYNDETSLIENDTEIKLSELEVQAAPIIKRIIENATVKHLGETDHKVLCLFTAVQMLRTNDTRDLLNDTNEIIASAIGEWSCDPNTEVENFKRMSKEEIKQSSIGILNNLPVKMVEHFLDKELSLMQAADQQNFYMSDNPVVMHNHIPREGRGNLGIGLKGIEIYFPISPKFCLSFFCKESMDEIKRRVRAYQIDRALGLAKHIDISEAQGMVDQMEMKRTRKLMPINMDFYNSLQVIQSSRYVYSNKAGFLLAKEMLRTHPEISTQPKVVDGSLEFE